MTFVGGVYLNFALWAVSLIPAWLVIGKIGMSKGGDGEIENKGADSLSPVNS